MSIPQSGGGLIEHPDQLAEHLAKGCKPKADWRIGTEHEKFGFLTDTLDPLPYSGPRSISVLFDRLASRFGWEKIFEGDNVIGLTKNGANVSLEPGGQFELSGAPLTSINETAAELDSHFNELRQITSDLGINFMGIGAAPIWSHQQMPMMPKGRYKLMTPYMESVGTHGTQMMYRTCTVQVNLDFASEADMVKKMRVALALQPVATALFASSPFLDGKLNGHKSWRSRIWRGLDNTRTGMLPFVFEPGMGFQAYVDYALDVPMYFVYRNGRYINALGQSFRDFLAGKLPALPGEKPTLSDWADHLTTIFPEARLKRFIEMRGADAGNRAHMIALSAFWVGLIYDEVALDGALEVIKPWGAQTREAWRVGASVHGLQAEVSGRLMLDLANEVLALSEAGLKARGLGEERWLQPLVESVQSGKVQADRLLGLYENEWRGDLNEVYPATSLL
jgi:glutamate--cysteine ligase